MINPASVLLIKICLVVFVAFCLIPNANCTSSSLLRSTADTLDIIKATAEFKTALFRGFADRFQDILIHVNHLTGSVVTSLQRNNTNFSGILSSINDAILLFLDIIIRSIRNLIETQQNVDAVLNTDDDSVSVTGNQRYNVLRYSAVPRKQQYSAYYRNHY